MADFHEVVKLRGKIRDRLMKHWKTGRVKQQRDLNLNAKLRQLNNELIEEENEPGPDIE